LYETLAANNVDMISMNFGSTIMHSHFLRQLLISWLIKVSGNVSRVLCALHFTQLAEISNIPIQQPSDLYSANRHNKDRHRHEYGTSHDTDQLQQWKTWM